MRMPGPIGLTLAISIASLSTISVTPATAPREEIVNTGSGPAAPTLPEARSQTTGPAQPSRQIEESRPGLSCKAGRNGGATDVGVTATSIRLASTVVQDGPAASLLGDSPKAMQAVVNRVNRAGGICGRTLDLEIVNDGFDAQRGQVFLRNFINSDRYFALPVVPSAEGLSSAIASGDISRAGMPVVGSDGMRIEQYEDPWVWPVATATVSTMRAMVKYAVDVRRSKTFGIVWDSKYKFGVEGKDAFIDMVKRKGGRIITDVALDPDQPSYASEAQRFNEACAQDACDTVALLLLPDAASKWLSRRPVMGKLLTSGAQTLFTDDFARACVVASGNDCNGFVVWTGFNPPVGTLSSLPDVARFIDDVRSIDPQVDIRNQFLEGAYLGMEVFVEALRRVGADLTRARLKATLDSMRFESDLSGPLVWRTGNHKANPRAQAFSLVAINRTFTGWRKDQAGWIEDPGER